MSSVSLEAYIVYTGLEESKEKVLKEKVSIDRIEHVAVDLCSEHGFDETFVKEESDSSKLTFSAFDQKKKKKLTLILRGKQEELQEIEDLGILE